MGFGWEPGSSNRPRKLKQRFKAEGADQLLTNCQQLKLKSPKDGKRYKTDVAITEQLFRVVQSIPSPKAEQFKLWLAQVGRERIEETIDPELTIDRALETYQKKYYDARHVCYAYMLGHERKDFRANDNGEPSGTAGKPILGQINSNELTDILIIVVRYFGGIKLGTSGLIVAYKAAAAEAIAAATVIEKTVDETVTFLFEYPFMNDVMRVVKEEEPEILEQSYDMDCRMTLRIRQSMMPKLRARLEKVETLRFE